MPTERDVGASVGATSAASASSSVVGGKWGERASVDPFAVSAASVEPEETANVEGKENKAPTSTSMTVACSPTVLRTAKPPPASLGKRPRGPSPTRSPLTAFKVQRVSTGDEDNETQRTLFGDDTKPVVLSVTDSVTVAELAFGAVAVGQRKTLKLTLTNPSQAGNARIKYDGYVMTSATRENLPKQTLDARFKCDLHVCTVPAEGKVTLRITFEPLTQDIHQELVARLRFTVNDRFRLQCDATGSGSPALAKPLSLRERMAMGASAYKPKTATEESETKAESVRVESIEDTVRKNKRRESLAMVVSPPRHRKAKRVRVEEQEVDDDGTMMAGPVTGGFQGSWWEKRKTLSDEEWMQRQEEGFTKWMNFVLIESTGDDEQDQENAAMIIEHPHRMSLGTPSRSGRQSSRQRRRTRIDFSSLRVLAMKRMESMWSRAAMEIYRSDGVTEAAANLKNEIAEGKMVVRRDRPAYADIGLQEELIELLNNYHPVWLCLALETVLGHRTMAQEKCSLRSVMTYCANIAEKSKASKQGGKKQGDATTRMPRQLRRVIIQHLVHDVQVAKRHRLVKNLKTPVESGGTSLRTAKANPKISGREYFDALMDAFVFKFLMVVLLLDRAAERRSDQFARFPCLFRVQAVKPKIDDDTKKFVKNSQGMIAEFCRLFLSKEGRIDRHLKQLGYTVQFQQVPLDEVELEITNLAVDLRDGVRLAKLLEMLTATPGASQQQKLSAFLRVPALSRLQKIHNVEICLHFLQEKCGRDFLESIRSTVSQSSRTAGRLSFATMRDKEDAKLLESMAKSVVDGHREKTLALLWKLISVFQLRSLVNVDRLTKEIQNIKQRMSFRSMEFYENAKAASTASNDTSNVAHEENQGLDHDVRELLLEWCRVVCANYFIRITDFSESFADGRAMCYLLHYYHPMLLTKNEIKITTTEYATSTTRAIHSEREITKALENERRHFTMVNERVKQLGEVPVLLPEQQYDSTNPPDDRVIVTFVCYLQSRLMDSSREIHAAARLKRWWRSPRIRLMMRRKKNNAARMIQRMWYTSSVKRLAIRRCRRLLHAARLIAATMSAWLHRARFLKLRRAVVTLQRIFKQKKMISSMPSVESVNAACKIQKAWRCRSLHQHVEFSIKKRVVCKPVIKQISASRIKCLLKVNVQHKREAREALHKYQEMLYQQKLEAGKKVLLRKVQLRCARKLQACAQAFLHHKHESTASIKLQTVWRGYIARKQYSLERVSMIRIQRAVRWWIKKREDEAKERFRRMLAEQERERKQKVLQAKVEKRSACRVQSAWRRFAFKKRAIAATKIQGVYRGKQSQKLLQTLKSERDHHAALVLQKWSRMVCTRRLFTTARSGMVLLQGAVRGVLSRKHHLNFAKFRFNARRMRTKMAKWKIEEWTKQIVHRRQQLREAATIIQKTWRMHTAYSRMQAMIQSSIRIQALVRGVQSRSNKLNFFQFRTKIAHTRMLLAAWTIASWARTRLAKYYHRLDEAATIIQSRVRQCRARCKFVVTRKAAIKIQARFKGMRSRETVLNFSVFKLRAMGSRKRLAMWRIQAWVLRCVEHRRRASAAIIIQKTVRMHVQRMRLHQQRVAVIKIQACVRGQLYRRCVFDFASFKIKQQRCRRKMALWKLQHWLAEKVYLKRIFKLLNGSAQLIQTIVRCYVARQKFLAMRHAAVAIQSLVRGVQSRCFKHDHAAYRSRMQRLRAVCAAWKIQLWMARHYKLRKACRSAMIKAKWTRLTFGLLRKRLRAVDTIARCWTAHKMRQTIVDRIHTTRVKKFVASTRIRQWCSAMRLKMAAKRELESLRLQRLRQIQCEREAYAAVGIERWWRGMRLQHAAKRELSILRAKRMQEMQREREERAAISVQQTWRNKVTRVKARHVRESLKKLRVFCASICVGNAVLRHVVQKNRQQRGQVRAVSRVQSWWRGMLVRLHEKRQAVTAQRKKLATMTLVAQVTPEPHESSEHQAASKKPATESSQPLTLGARLEMALHMLLHGKRLQEMLFASHTIELCTRYSRECAYKCVQLKISTTIFAAIRGLNRSRPHVELLHQLLLVLVNLTTYQRKESKNYTLPSIVDAVAEAQPVDQDDLRAVDALVDLLHVHRDMHVVFVLAARILKHYLLVLKPQTALSKEVFEQWSESHRRLRALHELLTKKMQVAAWTSKTATPSKASGTSANSMNPNANVLAKINPKTAVSVVGQLLKVLE